MLRTPPAPDEQIIAIVKEQEAGAKTADLCQRHGVSDATFYKWKPKYGGLEVSEAGRRKALEDENTRLKRCCLTPCSTMPRSRRSREKTGDARRGPQATPEGR